MRVLFPHHSQQPNNEQRTTNNKQQVPMTEFDTDLLAELVTRKRECLLKLRTMVEKQLELATDGSVTALLDMLSSKQRVIIELQDVEKALSPFRNQDPNRRRWRLPQARQQCAQRLAECETLMGQIMSEEKESELVMVRRRDETARQLQGAHQAGRAREAYSAELQSVARQIDLSSGPSVE